MNKPAIGVEHGDSGGLAFTPGQVQADKVHPSTLPYQSRKLCAL